MRTIRAIAASVLVLSTAMPAFAQGAKAQRKLDFTTIVSGSKGPAQASKVYIDTDTGYAAFLGGLYMSDPDAVKNLSPDLQQFDDNKYRCVAIELGTQANASAVKVSDVSTDGKTITVSYAAVPGGSGAPYCLIRFARQEGVVSSITSMKFVDTAAPPLKKLPFTTILTGTKGPAQGSKVFIDTDTGYAGFLAGLSMSDLDAVNKLPSDLQQFDDNKYRCIAIELGTNAVAKAVKVTDVSTDGKTYVVSYVVTPAGLEAPATPYTLVRFPRVDTVPSSITAVKFVPIAPPPSAPKPVKVVPIPAGKSTEGLGGALGGALGKSSGN